MSLLPSLNLPPEEALLWRRLVRPPLEVSAALQRRSPSLLLPEEPSREELAQFWTLSPRDRAEVMRCQGSHYHPNQNVR